MKIHANSSWYQIGWKPVFAPIAFQFNYAYLMKWVWMGKPYSQSWSRIMLYYLDMRCYASNDLSLTHLWYIVIFCAFLISLKRFIAICLSLFVIIYNTRISYGIFGKHDGKRSYLTFWFARNDLRPTTNKDYHSNDNSSHVQYYGRKCNLQCPKFNIRSFAWCQ